MKKKTNKKISKSLDVAVAKKAIRRTVKKIDKKLEKASSSSVPVKVIRKTAKSLEKKVVQSSTFKVAGKVAKNSLKKIEKSPLDEFKKKAKMKISTEFAIAIILVISGTFAYIFLKESSGKVFTASQGLPEKISVEIRSERKNDNQKDDRWKTFRSEDAGNEFSLPAGWKVIRTESGEKFISEYTPEEIMVVNEDNADNYDARELLENVIKNDKEANAKLLVGQNGVIIEKREEEILRQTARLILGKRIVTVTYSTYGKENSGFFVDKILPTFKAI